jgi:hypothetical protein
MIAAVWNLQGTRSFVIPAALALSLLLGTEQASARLGQGFGPGNRLVFAAVTATSANAAVALDPGLAAKAGQQPNPGGSLGDLFNRPGLLGGFAAGFLGSGVLGLLFGRGLFGGLGGAASYLGLAFQLVLIVMLFRLIWTRWRGGNAPAFAGLSPRQLADPYLRSRNDLLAGADRFANTEQANEDDNEDDPVPQPPAAEGRSPDIVEASPRRER